MIFTKKDFQLEWFSGSGAGGQYRNKHQNCCRIRHPASGLVAQSTAHRSRVANQKAAFRRLAGMLIAFYELSPARKERQDGKEVVRSYHFIRGEMRDHATDRKDAITEAAFDEQVRTHRFGDQSRQTGRM